MYLPQQATQTFLETISYESPLFQTVTIWAFVQLLF
jgi:hypothetical protein